MRDVQVGICVLCVCVCLLGGGGGQAAHSGVSDAKGAGSASNKGTPCRQLRRGVESRLLKN